MKIYNTLKSQIITNPDLTKGYLKLDVLKKIIPAQTEVKEQCHIEIIKEYPNGGKDVRTVIDVPYQAPVEEHEEIEEIQVYIPYTQLELFELSQQELRDWREQYFKVIDCAVWYDCLTTIEKEQVKQFRYNLLDITKTMQKPAVPECVAIRMK